MNAELLMDAMGYLPDEMVEKTNNLRIAKSISWQKWTAWAACICLVLGAGILLLPGTANKSAGDSAAPENMLADYSTTLGPIVATVQKVEKDCLTVTLADGTLWEVSLVNLTEIPALEPGMEVNIFLGEEPADEADSILFPDRITVKEE